MKNLILLLLVPLVTSAASAAGAPSIVEKLQQEEATWHKYFLFTTAVTLRKPDERALALEWFKNKVTQTEMPDSRYALTYSAMLWQSRDPTLAETSVTLAIAGYTALQLESARCDNRGESLQVARQWYDAVRPQLLSLRKLPADKRKELHTLASKYLAGAESPSMKETKQDNLWLCYLLPSYLNKIRPLPDTVIENRSSGTFMHVFISNPSVRPDLASQEDFDRRRKKIADDVVKFVVDGQ